jgi:hypothetical protein
VLAAGWERERERERKAAASPEKGGGAEEGGSGQHVVEEAIGRAGSCWTSAGGAAQRELRSMA